MRAPRGAETLEQVVISVKAETADDMECLMSMARLDTFINRRQVSSVELKNVDRSSSRIRSSVAIPINRPVRAGDEITAELVNWDLWMGRSPVSIHSECHILGRLEIECSPQMRWMIAEGVDFQFCDVADWKGYQHLGVNQCQ